MNLVKNKHHSSYFLVGLLANQSDLIFFLYSASVGIDREEAEAASEPTREKEKRSDESNFIQSCRHSYWYDVYHI